MRERAGVRREEDSKADREQRVSAMREREPELEEKQRVMSRERERERERERPRARREAESTLKLLIKFHSFFILLST